MEQQFLHRKEQAAKAQTPQLSSQAPTVSQTRTKKLIRAVKLLDVLTSGDQALLDYLAENREAAAQAVELAREDMAEAETPEEAEDLRPDPIDELIADAQSVDLQSLRDMLLEQCRSTIAAEIDLLPLRPNCLIAQCCVAGCEVHELSPQGEIVRHIPISCSNADPLLSHCRQLLTEDEGIAYIEVYDDHLVPIWE